jgi:hypothetical protein
MKYFTEITYFDEPTDREVFYTAEDAAEAYAQAIDQARTYGVHFGDWAQIRRGTITTKGRTITHRHNNEVTA